MKFKLQIELNFKKKNRGIWKTYGTHKVSKEKLTVEKRHYTEYEVIENTKLCKYVHFMVLKAKDYMQIIPPGRHIEVKMDVMGKFTWMFYSC